MQPIRVMIEFTYRLPNVDVDKYNTHSNFVKKSWLQLLLSFVRQHSVNYAFFTFTWGASNMLLVMLQRPLHCQDEKKRKISGKHQRSVPFIELFEAQYTINLKVCTHRESWKASASMEGQCGTMVIVINTVISHHAHFPWHGHAHSQ